MALIFVTTGFAFTVEPGEGVGVGVGFGVVVGVGVAACFTFAQRFTFPDLTQIRFVGFDFAIIPTLEHLSPTFTAAALGCICPSMSTTSKNTLTYIPIE
jgi:hypothetical protein